VKCSKTVDAEMLKVTGGMEQFWTAKTYLVITIQRRKDFVT
jgi:hypothetical protein